MVRYTYDFTSVYICLGLTFFCTYKSITFSFSKRNFGIGRASNDLTRIICTHETGMRQHNRRRLVNTQVWGVSVSDSGHSLQLHSRPGDSAHFDLVSAWIRKAGGVDSIRISTRIRISIDRVRTLDVDKQFRNGQPLAAVWSCCVTGRCSHWGR